jgi:hypothetical protein
VVDAHIIVQAVTVKIDGKTVLEYMNRPAPSPERIRAQTQRRHVRLPGPRSGGVIHKMSGRLGRKHAAGKPSLLQQLAHDFK